MNNGKLFIGLALGALAGGALACFAHSQRGKRMRQDLYETLQDLRNSYSCMDGSCEESCDCPEHHHHHHHHHHRKYPQPDEVIEVVAGKADAPEEKPKA